MTWLGNNTIFGVAKGATWQTPVAVGAGHRVYINSESLTPDAQLVPSLSLTGSAFDAAGDKGDEFHAGDVVCEADYDTIHRMLAFAMGTAGVPSAVGSGTFRHQLRVANNLEGIFTTAVVGALGEFVREYPSVKHNGFSIEHTHGERVAWTFPLIPSGVNFNTASGTNELTSLPNIAFPTGADTDYLIFNDLEVLINDASAAALTSPTDDAYITTIAAEFAGNHKEDDVTTRYAPNVDEPLRDGSAALTGRIEFSKLASTAFLADLLTKTKKKMLWRWTGAIADGSEAYVLEMFFSEVQFSTGNFNIPGKGYVPKILNFQAAKPAVAHAGFDFADAFYINVVNQQSGNPLA